MYVAGKCFYGTIYLGLLFLVGLLTPQYEIQMNEKNNQLVI